MSLVFPNSHCSPITLWLLIYKQCARRPHLPSPTASCRGSDKTDFFSAGLANTCPFVWLLTLFGLIILPVPQKEALLFPLQVNDFSMVSGRQVLCTGGLDIQQRCYQPCQPILAHARTGVRVACWRTNRQTGKAGGQMHLTYTHCSFNNFDTNYFYKFFQGS